MRLVLLAYLVYSVVKSSWLFIYIAINNNPKDVLNSVHIVELMF